MASKTDSPQPHGHHRRREGSLATRRRAVQLQVALAIVVLLSLVGNVWRVLLNQWNATFLMPLGEYELTTTTTRTTTVTTMDPSFARAQNRFVLMLPVLPMLPLLILCMIHWVAMQLYIRN